MKTQHSLRIRRTLRPPKKGRQPMNGPDVQVFTAWLRDSHPDCCTPEFVADDEYGPQAQASVANLKTKKGYTGGAKNVCGTQFFQKLVPAEVVTAMNEAARSNGAAATQATPPAATALVAAPDSSGPPEGEASL